MCTLLWEFSTWANRSGECWWTAGKWDGGLPSGPNRWMIPRKFEPTIWSGHPRVEKTGNMDHNGAVMHTNASDMSTVWFHGVTRNLNRTKLI